MYFRASPVSAHPSTYSGSIGAGGSAAASVGVGFVSTRGHSLPVATASRNAAYRSATDFQLHSRSTHALALWPKDLRRSGRATSTSRYSYSVSSSVASTGTFKQTSSGYSANDP